MKRQKEIFTFSSKALFFGHASDESGIAELWECPTGRRLSQYHSDTGQQVTSISFNNVLFTLILEP